MMKYAFEVNWRIKEKEKEWMNKIYGTNCASPEGEQIQEEEELIQTTKQYI